MVRPQLQTHKWRLLRFSIFAATGLSAFAYIVHAESIFLYEQLDCQAGLQFYHAIDRFHCPPVSGISKPDVARWFQSAETTHLHASNMREVEESSNMP